MTLDQLIDIANAAYGDDLILQYHRNRQGNYGDGLAKFIAVELAETFEADAAGKEQTERAAEVMGNAQDELAKVYCALFVATAKED